MIALHILPILVAAIVSAVIGFLWYHPRAFGTLWMRLSGITPEAVERGKNNMPLMALCAFLASVVAAYILNYFEILSNVSDVVEAMKVGLLAWLGFVAPTMLGMVLWEQKPLTLYFINSLYWLVSLIAMSLVLTL